MVKKMVRGTKRYISLFGIRGLMKASIAKIFNKIALIDIKREDCRFPIWIRLRTSDVSVYQQVFVNCEYNFIVNANPEVIVDAGANIGLTSIYLANKFPDSRIIAIEPEKNNFEILSRNTALYSNITPVNAALWDSNEVIELMDPGSGNWGFITNASNSSNEYGSTVHRVKAMTVESLLTEFNLNKIDIFKIDIEGAEKEVFLDTSLWIDKVDSIIIELHERIKPGCIKNVNSGTRDLKKVGEIGESIYLSRKDSGLSIKQS